MRQYSTIILCLLITAGVRGQIGKNTCTCPRSEFIGYEGDVKPDTSFQFNNGKTIVLCGYKDTKTVKGKTLFEEFILAICGQDTIIDFWDATKTCQLHKVKDTLFVEELQNLQTGKNLNYRQTVWTIEKLHFVNGKIVRKLSPNRNIRKYTADEIKRVIKEYQTTQNIEANSVKAEDIFYKLFMATISGDKEARKTFIAFQSKFPYLGEHFIEEYDALRKC